MLDKLTKLRLQHNVDTTPISAMNVLWGEAWKVAFKASSVYLHNHLPAERLHELDDTAMEILTSLGVSVNRESSDRSIRRFVVNGQIVRETSKGWIQD